MSDLLWKITFKRHSRSPGNQEFDLHLGQEEAYVATAERSIDGVALVLRENLHWSGDKFCQNREIKILKAEMLGPILVDGR